MGFVAVDLDGTMIDTVPDFQLAINEMLCGIGAKGLSQELIETFVGKGSEHLVRASLEVDHSVEEADRLFDQALASYQLAYGRVNGSLSRVYPGVREGLEQLALDGLRLACVTNKPHAFAVALLQKVGLLPYFELILGGDSVRHKKPDPEPFRMVCRHFGIEPKDLVAIGDSSNDARAARDAGCLCVIVSYGYNHGADVRTLDTDAIVDSLLEAATWIRNLQSPVIPTHGSV